MNATKSGAGHSLWGFVRCTVVAICLAGSMVAVSAVTSAEEAAPDQPMDAMSVDSLLREVRARNPELAAALHELEAAKQRVAPAQALDDPMLEAGVVSLPLPLDSTSFHREDMTMKMLGVSQRLPFPGKRELRGQVASKDAESMAFAYQETVNRVLRDAQRTYLELALIRQSHEIIVRNRAVIEQFLRVAEARYSVGQGAQPDVLRAQTQLTRMTDELLRTDREEATLQAELRRLLDRTSDAGTILPVPSTYKSRTFDVNALREAAVQDRPQLRGLQSVIDRYDREVELMQREFYPDFDVRLIYGQRERALDGMPRDDMVSLTVAVNLPIWRKSRLDPQLAEARAMRERARAMYAAQTAGVTAALDSQLATAAQSQRSVALIQAGLQPQSRLALESSLSAYRVGRIDFLSLLDSQMTVYTYELELARAITAYQQSLAEIDFLVGRNPVVGDGA